VFKRLGLLLIIALLVVPMILVACGNDESDDEVSSSGLKLNQEIKGGGLKIKYPEGWADKTFEDGTIMIANNDDALENADGAGNGPQKGELGVIVMAIPMSETMAERSAEELLGMMASGLSSGGIKAEVNNIKIGDKDVYRADSTPEYGMDEINMGFKLYDLFVFIAAVATEGEIGTYEDAILEIVESIEYSGVNWPDNWSD
jgi:hypothetical protein